MEVSPSSLGSAANLPGGAEMAQRYIRMVIIGGCNGFCLPLEMVLRPRYGTRYFLLTSYAWSWGVMQSWLALSWVIRIFRALAPGIPAETRPVDMGTVLLIFYALFVYHVIRLRRLVVNMNLEKDSEMENSGWKLLRYLPSGKLWTRQRMVYEPVICAAMTIGLYRAEILAFPATAFLLIGSISLSLKATMIYWQGWEFVRGGRDAMARTSVMRAFGKNPDDAPERIGDVVMESIATVDHEGQVAILQHANKGTLPPELERLLSK